MLLLFLNIGTALDGLITHVTVFEAKENSNPQLIILCGDQHQLGSWEDNVQQFLNFAQLGLDPSVKMLFLVENLTSPNDHFNRPQDKIILQAKQEYVLESLTQNYTNPNPKQMPTVLHFFGCSTDFFRGMCKFLHKSLQLPAKLSSLPTINIDNRHRNIYYGEALAGWLFPPYCHPQVKAIQQSESTVLTLQDLLSPQETLRFFLANSAGWLRSMFDEILDRQELHKKTLFQYLKTTFNIQEPMLTHDPIARLSQQHQQQNLYDYLQHSPLEKVLREMVEANALWHISQRTADVIIVFAGTNHTGHTDSNWAYQTPGLSRFLHWLGYKQIQDNGYSSIEIAKRKQELSRRLRTDIPLMIEESIKKFTIKYPQVLAANQIESLTSEEKIATSTMRALKKTKNKTLQHRF